MAVLSLLVVGVLYFLANWAGPDILNAYRAQRTEAALAQAREALLGYATRYRDTVDANAVYGYLPLPDLGSTRNNNLGCVDEGCDAGNFLGVAADVTVIGRFPWRLLGTEPLRDGYGECLWLAVSGSYKRVQPSAPPMNWDTLGQIDVVAANGAVNLASILATAHDRPVAIIFSPGIALPNQNRGETVPATDDVTQCGGNYDVANYLDPGVAGALAGVTNFFGGSANNAFGDTSAATKSLTNQGSIQRRADATLWPLACPAGANCTLAANDKGLALTPEPLFGAIRRSSSFRTDINTMLDQMVSCLRDQMAAGGAFLPDPIAGYASPPDKSAGRIQNNACYNNTPPGYFNHWRDQFFVAQPTAGTFNVTVDGVAQVCNGVLIFAGQRGAGQSRIAALGELDLPANYLEGVNLASFTAVGTGFAGPSLLDVVSAAQTAQQDIVRCVPTTTSFLETGSPELTAEGLPQLVDYDPGTRTLTLGAAGVDDDDVQAGALFGCAWTPEADARGKGFRVYFTFRFMGVTGGVGNNGFVFAAIDGESNGTNVCGAAGSHLGYSGDNGVTPRVAFPKIGIEFDMGRNRNFTESTDLDVRNPGRNDPCGVAGCGGTVGYNTHAAFVYWGHESANATDGVTLPNDDDNVHGFPTTGSLGSNPRPAPQNPGNLAEVPPGIAFKDFTSHSDSDGDGEDDSYLYHVRVELTPARNVNSSAAETSNTSFVANAWIIRDSLTDAQIIAAMQNTTRSMAQLQPTVPATLSDTATVYDVRGGACGGGCPTNQTCGTDNFCYRQGLKSVRLGFTGSQRSQDQKVRITNFTTSWLQ
jgi:hypothetical protein